MLNLNPAINLIPYFSKQGKSILKQLLSLLSIAGILYMHNYNAGHCQTLQSLPVEFQFLSTNSRALEKTTNLTIDKFTKQSTQNLPLDKTGVILHISTTPKIKDNNIKIRVFSSEGEEVQLFPFKEDLSFFTLINPEKNYSISEEIKINCNELNSNFTGVSGKFVCPDSELFKIADNIMLLNDTSFKIMLISPSEFYLLPLQLTNPDPSQSNTNLIQILKEDTQNTTNDLPVSSALQNVLEKSTLCLTGSVQNLPSQLLLDCNIINEDIKSQIVYKDNLKNINTSDTNNVNLVFSSLTGFFTSLKNTATVAIEEVFESTDAPEEISKDSEIPEVKFNNYNLNLKLNLGGVKKGKTRIKKDIFSIKTPLDLTKILSKVTFSIPTESIENFINPFSEAESKSPLISITINGRNKSNSNTFTIQANNNIVLKSLIEATPTPTPTPSTQAMALISQESNTFFQAVDTNPNIQIISYLPADSYNINVGRNYSFIEENIAPSVNEKGKAIEIINNKSKDDFSFNTSIDKDITENTKENIFLTFNKASDIIKKENSFTKPFLFSGFLIPPDFRPVVEEGYRATISIERIFNIPQDDQNTINLNYKDIKTKDETTLTNFFKFLFVPEGEYKTRIKFDSNREDLFIMAGLIKKAK